MAQRTGKDASIYTNSMTRCGAGSLMAAYPIPREVRMSLAARRLLSAVIACTAVAIVTPISTRLQALPTFQLVASGLDNPRGLAFGPEGGLYIAEAGRGGA